MKPQDKEAISNQADAASSRVAETEEQKKKRLEAEQEAEGKKKVKDRFSGRHPNFFRDLETKFLPFLINGLCKVFLPEPKAADKDKPDQAASGPRRTEQ